MTLFSEKNNLLFLLALTALLALWNLGAAPLMEWDESRNGVSAIEMRQNADALNLHFGGKPDEWNVKPPLFIWLVLLSFELLGEHAFALRLPSALASIFSVFFIFKIIRLYRSVHFATIVILILLSVKGFLGPHVGRSGDYDALMIGFSLAGIYYFLQYLEFKNPSKIYPAAFFWGLAFWTKGPAVFIIFPGLLLYVIGTGRLRQQLKNQQLWKGLLLFLGIIGTWVLAIHLFGLPFTTGEYAGKNAFQRIFLNDVLARFSDSHFDHAVHDRDYAFFFTYLDTRFNIWNYLFYPALLVILVAGFRKRKSLLSELNKHPLLFLSCCLWFSAGLFFSLATTKHHWYLAPFLPFISITLVYGFYPYWSRIKYLIAVLLIFTLGRQWYSFQWPPSLPASAQTFDSVLEETDELLLAEPLPRQHELLYLHFSADKIIYLNKLEEVEQHPTATLLFVHQSQEPAIKNLESSWEKTAATETHLFFKKVSPPDVSK